MKPLCIVCSERPVKCKDRCHRCYQYRLETGRDRNLKTICQLYGGPCVNCGGSSGPYVHKRCKPCYWYFQRMGVDRPARLYRDGILSRDRKHAPCVNCGTTSEEYLRQSRCSSCAKHLRRWGIDRPPEGLRNGERYYNRLIRSGVTMGHLLLLGMMAHAKTNPTVWPVLLAVLPHLVKTDETALPQLS